MSLLERAESSKRKRPYYLALYTPPGLGKSTMASEAPNPIFIDTEGGLAHLDVKAFQPKTFDEVLAFVGELLHGKHSYQTLVIDTLDHMEKLVFQNVCRKEEKAHIEDISYKRGYIYAVDEWRKLTDLLAQLREKMHVILLAHAHVKNTKNPMGDDYDRFQMKIHDKASALITEVVDALLFGNYETFTKKEGSKVKAFGDGARIVHTENRPGFMAKNRYGLPITIPLGWNEFVSAAESDRAGSADQIKEVITQLIPQMPNEEIKEKAKKAFIEAGNDVVKLAKIKDRINLVIEGATHG